ncbi:cytochrome P450 [Hygrophoropsis aurantiaca]|uniref:Cytochrome P450 n=1 Tax=Hygrophoropsis aurantiaca TaxID=72124 RepID=A0ACB8AGM5_9AGAM|nr:cytochrome P450 [Hygrophoropsis aurantiaca]
MDTIVSTARSRWVVTAVALLFLKVAVGRYLSLRNAFHSIRKYPGGRILWIDPFHSLALVLAPVFPRPNQIGYYGGKLFFYKEFGATIFASVRFLTSQRFFWVGDAEALKIITSDRNTFQKDISQYEALNFFGPNLVSTEASDWKRHRAVAKPAFSEANVALVWTETIRIVNKWFQQLDVAAKKSPNGTNGFIVDLVSPMAQATLLVISAAGFGRRVSWTADSFDEPPTGFKLTFRSAVMNSVENVIFYVLTPTWFSKLLSFVKIPYLSSRAHITQQGFEQLERHMLDLVSSARAEVAEGKTSGGVSDAALLKNLVGANMTQEGDYKRLTDGELLSNIFTFLLAGHETSAHSLSFAFVLLALYPEAQEKLYEEASRLWPGDGPTTDLDVTYRDGFSKLEYTLALFRETLRLYPSEPRLAKDVHYDSVLPAVHFTPGSKGSPTIEGHPFSVAVPAGSVLILDIWALHMNPLYWGDDVEEFKPERFLDSDSYRWPRNAFMPFSNGARSCIGQRFALTESVCILANVVRRYEILVPDDLATKSIQEQKDALLKWTTGVTITPTNARVKFRRRI